jgi:acetyl esterase/lipase
MGNRGGIDQALLDKLLKAGYAVVSVDYRLAPETKLPAILEDLEDACTWVREKGPELFHIDPERVAVMGGSAGGYLTLASGFRVKPRPKALVAFWGYGDIAGTWYSRPDPFYSKMPLVPKEEAYQAVGGPVLAESSGRTNRQRFYLYCRQQGLWPREVAGHDPDKEPRAFDEWCPLRNVSAKYPPTLLIHGTADTDVPYEQSKLMAEELARKGVEHELPSLRWRPRPRIVPWRSWPSSCAEAPRPRAVRGREWSSGSRRRNSNSSNLRRGAAPCHAAASPNRRSRSSSPRRSGRSWPRSPRSLSSG